MQHENENDVDGTLSILKSLHKYVPAYGDGEESNVGSKV
jgi:hypothetical protein